MAAGASAPAAAQDQQEAGGAAPRPDQPLMVASFGWGGMAMPAEHWSPVTVHITAGDRPLSGTIVMEFPQDETQSASIAVPFAATPNRTTPVQIVAALPTMCDRVTFTMYTERGRAVRSLTYTRTAASLTAQLPALHDADRPLLVAVGRSTIPESVRDWAMVRQAAGVPAASPRPGRTGTSPLPLPDLSPGWADMGAARSFPDELPISWTAYDGVAALVVHAEGATLTGRSADPRAIRAVHEWVASGGRLVVVADAPGESWREWLPPHARAILEVDPLAAGAASTSFAAVLDRERVLAESQRQTAELIAGEATPEPEIPRAVESLPRRLVRLRPAAADAGWKTRWPVPDAPGAALLAEGPVGYGFVVVLGADPARVPATLSTRATGAVWRSALGTALEDWLDAAEEKATRAGGWWGGYVQTTAQRATSAALERLGDVPVIGDWIFLVIAACIAVLAAMVGPVDYFVLRRFKSGQRSWITAIVWIGIASAVAYSAPRVIRAAPTRVNRLTVVDRMIPSQGYVAGAPGAEGTALTFASGLTGIYSGESGRARFVKPDPSSWWRGVSIEYPYWGVRPLGRGKGVVPTFQAAAGGAAGSDRGNPLEVVPLGLWTFRTFADMSRPAASVGPEVTMLTARIHETPEGYSVRIAGLPGGIRVTQAALRVADRWYSLTRRAEAAPPSRHTVPLRPVDPERAVRPPGPPVGVAGDTTWSAAFPDEFAGPAAPAPWDNPPMSQEPMYYPAPVAIDTQPGPLLDLAGPARRRLAVERLLGTGRWGVVYLNLEDFPLDAALDWPSTWDHTCVVRLLVPLDTPVEPATSDTPPGTAP